VTAARGRSTGLSCLGTLPLGVTLDLTRRAAAVARAEVAVVALLSAGAHAVTAALLPSVEGQIDRVGARRRRRQRDVERALLAGLVRSERGHALVVGERTAPTGSEAVDRTVAFHHQQVAYEAGVGDRDARDVARVLRDAEPARRPAAVIARLTVR